jgi:hypothetical protein
MRLTCQGNAQVSFQDLLLLLCGAALTLMEVSLSLSLPLSRASGSWMHKRSHIGGIYFLFSSHTQLESSDNNDMVIPPSCPGVNVEILVDGQPLQEYDEIDECPVAPNTAIKYIEARSEAEFAVKVRIDHDFPFPAGDIEVKTILDQQHTARKILEVRKLFNPVGMLIEGYKARIGYGTDVLYKFRFVALDLGEFHFCALLKVMVFNSAPNFS